MEHSKHAVELAGEISCLYGYALHGTEQERKRKKAIATRLNAHTAKAVAEEKKISAEVERCAGDTLNTMQAKLDAAYDALAEIAKAASECAPYAVMKELATAARKEADES